MLVLLRTLQSHRRVVSVCGLFVSLLTQSFAATQTLTPDADTFIELAAAQSNNGASSSIFLGRSIYAGAMRGLFRFDMPASLSGRVEVSGASFNLTTRAAPSGEIVIAASSVGVYKITAPWVEGNGVNTLLWTETQGQPCGNGIFGATWQKPDCSAAPTWNGGTIDPAIRSFTHVPNNADIDVTFGSSLMTADVQSWIDTPSGNHGWLLLSQGEAALSSNALHFFSSEAGMSTPNLAITYNCKAGFTAAGSECTTCTPAAQDSCAVTNGNSCVDPGPPSTAYSCICSNTLYRLGVTQGGGVRCEPRVLDVDDNGDFDSLTDGLLILRYLFGLTGQSLTSNATGAGAQRTAPATVLQYLDSVRGLLDVDGNASTDALTDGLVLIRYLFGLRGPALVSGALGPGPVRSAAEIEIYFQSSLLP